MARRKLSELAEEMAVNDVQENTEETTVQEEMPTTPETTEVQEPAVSTETVANTETRQSRSKSDSVPGRIITIDGRYRSEGDERANTLSELQRDFRRAKVLTGEIASVEFTSAKNPYAIIYRDDFKVIIPVSEIINENDFEDNAEGRMEMRRHLSAMLGAEIDYIIKGIDAKEQLVTASRREAMAIVRKKFYTSQFEGSQPLVAEGGLVEARIISVAFKRIQLEVFGVDVEVSVEETAWQWISDMRESFYVGAKTVVKVLELITDGEDIKLSVSIKQAQEDPYLSAKERFKNRSSYVGEIKAVNDLGVYVNLAPGLDCLCPYPDWVNVHLCPGAKVSVMVIYVDPERRRIRGRLLRVISVV